jgi:hypothetical protein
MTVSLFAEHGLVDTHIACDSHVQHCRYLLAQSHAAYAIVGWVGFGCWVVEACPARCLDTDGVVCVLSG